MFSSERLYKVGDFTSIGLINRKSPTPILWEGRDTTLVGRNVNNSSPVMSASVESFHSSVQVRKCKILLYLLTGAAVTKYHKLDGLNDGNVFPHCPGSWKSEIQVSAGPCSLGRSYSRALPAVGSSWPVAASP